jgi:D-glycero-alpha-D-manno-heptose-7-phosphate kinase
VREVNARAPARIDFGGGWTDVPPYDIEQGGCVCNLAISRHATVRLIPSDDGVAIEDEGTLVRAASAEELPREGATALAGAALRRARINNVCVTMRSHFPAGAGLGGSSAAGVALAGALAAWRGEAPSRAELAELSRMVEVHELGVPGGRQDHYAAAFGGALGLRFEDRVHVEPIALSDELIAAIERQCLVCYTGRTRISGETITAVLNGYAARDAGVVSALRRMRDLAEQMISALTAGSLDALGAMVAEHWIHQRQLHPRITTPEIDTLLHAAVRAGAVGGKALGASGGGCVLVIAPDDSVAPVRAALTRHAELVPFMVDRTGVMISHREDA